MLSCLRVPAAFYYAGKARRLQAIVAVASRRVILNPKHLSAFK